MLFAEADAPHLRTWIIKRLENTSDADADVLADYVIALLRHDGDVDSIRKLFEEEIPDFLRDDSAAFTDDVFQAVKHKSYLPGAPPAPPIVRQAPAPVSQTPQIPTGPAALQQAPYQPTYDLQHTPYAETPTAFSSNTFRNGSKKRSYRDLDAPDTQPMNWDYGAGTGFQQPYKQARRGGGLATRGGRYDDPHAPRGPGGYGTYNGRASNVASTAFSGSGYGVPSSGYNPQQPFGQAQPTIDANTIMENIRQLQELGAQMGIHLPQTGSLPKPVYSGQTLSSSAPHQRRPPCRDYETKGYCSRGNRCQFEHGNSSLHAPSFQPPLGDEYDPNNATMGTLEHPGQPVKQQDMAAMQMPPFNRREPKKPKRKGGRAAFSAEGPTNDKTNTKIVVENVPEEHFTEDAIREYYNEFGTIQEIELRPIPGSQKRVAIVTFDSWAAANAAWKSPKVVFDNRFVKVYWFKDESQFGQDPRHVNRVKNGSANGETASTEPEFDLEEFKRKQEEAQKIHLEKQQKREELERQRQELEEKRKELIARQQEERLKLQAKLAANGVKEDSLSPILMKATANGEKPSQAEILRAKLAALEEEANSLGLDPDAADESLSWTPRGRGRGRRPYRGRGSYPSRAWRGGSVYRGRGVGATQDVHAAYAAFSLDNRPKAVVITGVDFTDPAKDEALRQHLFGIGEFGDISTDPSATHITFKDRKTAEQFMFGISGKKAIDGVDGELEVSWATSAPKTVGTSTDSQMANDVEEDQATKTDQVLEDHGTFSRANASSNQDDMDYEGGDWGS